MQARPFTLFLVGVVVLCVGWSSRTLAVDMPVVTIERTSEELVRVTVSGGAQASGYNIYRDDDYINTVRPMAGASAFPVRVGSRGGAFCVVAFDETDTPTTYSPCSDEVEVPAADPDSPDGDMSGPPSAPGNLRVTVYSDGVAELFWDRASDDGRVVAYRVTRDGSDLLETSGRSVFQPGLDPTVVYLYTVSAIDDDGNEGPAAELAVSAVAGGVQPPPPGTGDAPAAPTDLRGVAYSPGVVEIFWARSPDERAISGYEVLRDGESIAFTQGRSVFQTGLVAGQIYTYQLSAVSADGVRSEPLTLALRAGLPPAGDDYAVFATPDPIVVVEGDPDETSVELQIQRPQGGSNPLSISLLDAESDLPADLDVQLEPIQLAADQSTSRLSLTLPVAMAPRLARTGTLALRIDDGTQVVDATITVEIEPIDAPDVYLLIGQSNMEGYSQIGSKQDGPGEPDEPLERVQQLHVNANNARFFSAPGDFVDEAANTREPLFIPAEDPLHDLLFPGQPAKSGTFIGPALTFGKAALADTSREVFLVPSAWGATGFCANANGDRSWNAAPTDEPALGGTLLLDRALTRLEITLRETGGVLRGILWHQGGADSNNPRCAELYADNLVAMVQRVRSEARVDARGPAARGPDAAIPFVLATQSRGTDERGDFSIYNPFKQQVDAVHRNVAQLLPFADVVINDDLVPPAFPCGQSSCVHFGAAALREQGVRFHAALQRIRSLDAQAKPDDPTETEPDTETGSETEAAPDAEPGMDTEVEPEPEP